MEWLLAGSVVLYTLQAAYSTSLDKALEQTVFFYVPFALLFAVLRDIEWSPKRLKAGLLVLLGLALVFVAIGFVEYATRSLLLNPKVIASNELEEYFRVNSLFFDPNIYGRFLALVMLGLAGVLLWERRPRTAALAAVALAVLWGGLVLTLSQSSFAALLCGLFVLAALRFPLGARAARRRRGGGDRADRRARVPLGAAARPGRHRVARRRHLRPLRADPRRRRPRRGPADLGLGLGRRSPTSTWTHDFGARSDAVSASHTIPLTIAAEQGLIGLAVYLALLAAALSPPPGRRPRRSLPRGRGRRLRGRRGAHVALRRVPRGSRDVDAAGGRRRARAAPAPAGGRQPARSEPSRPEATPRDSIRSHAGPRSWSRVRSRAKSASR